MKHHGGVLAGLHHLVEVADGPAADRPGERPVHPGRLTTLEEVPADEVGRGEVLVAGHGDEVPARLVGHRLHEPGLPAAGGALQEDGQAAPGRRPEDLDLVADRPVEGRLRGGGHQ